MSFVVNLESSVQLSFLRYTLHPALDTISSFLFYYPFLTNARPTSLYYLAFGLFCFLQNCRFFLIIVGWQELLKTFWQHGLAHILTAFMLLDVFDLCFGFISLINLISIVASIPTEMISNNVLLIHVIAE